MSIFARSPYIVEISETGQDGSKVELFIWNGTGADEADNHGLFDFFARYVRKVPDEFICKTLKLGKGTSFIDVIGPNNIAYVIAVFKISQEMWDQVI